MRLALFGIWYGCSIDFDNDAKQEIGNVWRGVSRAMWLFRWPCVLFLITFEAACDVVAPLIYANNDVQSSVCCVKRKNERNSKQRKTMIRQIGRALCSYGWNFVCFDSVLSAWMTKGCAPDSAQVWAAQKGRGRRQVKKIACLLSTGLRKIIWKLVKKEKEKKEGNVVHVAWCGCFADFDLLHGKEAHVFADVVVSLTRSCSSNLFRRGVYLGECGAR